MEPDQKERQPLAIVVLAAGKGTRMRSARAKVLHPIGGAPMLAHAMRAANAVRPDRMVVVTGHDGAAVAAAAEAAVPDVTIAEQTEQRGTGHAVLTARPALQGFSGDVIVIFGDTPFLSAETLARVRSARGEGTDIVVLGFESETPGGYGRLVTGENDTLEAIVEACDAGPAALAIRLCNSGILAADAGLLFALLDRVGTENAQGEVYLTDVVAIARGDGLTARVVLCKETETLGINDRQQLAAAEGVFQARARRAAMLSGATLTAPETVWFAHDTVLGRDVSVGPHVVFGPGVRVAEGAEIRAFCHLEGAEVGAGALVGPFARLRPGAVVGPGAHIGNFVEIKNARIAEGAKANHLSYVGDASVGAGANLGAGTITCNYDGFSKHHTEIGARAFVGVNTALIAPVSVGEDAYIATGTVITEDVPADALAIARTRQTNKPGLASRLRDKFRAIKAAAGRKVG